MVANQGAKRQDKSTELSSSFMRKKEDIISFIFFKKWNAKRLHDSWKALKFSLSYILIQLGCPLGSSGVHKSHMKS